MTKLPNFLKKYFWDVDFSKINDKKHPQFIIERILEYGDERATKWLEENFDNQTIKKVLCQSKRLSPKSANFWQLIFSLKKEQILCLKPSFQKKRKLIWKY